MKRQEHFLHEIWERKLVNPFWDEVVEHTGMWVAMMTAEYLTASPVTAARVILRVWESSRHPALKDRVECMSETGSHVELEAVRKFCLLPFSFLTII